MKTDVLKDIGETKVVAIIRGMAPEICVNLAEAYAKGGIRLVEVTFDQTGDPETTITAIKAIREKVGDRMHVGAGTVLTSSQLEMLIAAGGEFMVTPNTNPALIRRANEAGLVTIPGAYTPTEVVTAHEAGADFVKLFPIRGLGARYVKDLLAPLKHIRLLAVGGVNAENAGEYVKAGCCGIGASGALVNKDMIAAGDWDGIAAEARKLIASVK